MTLEQKKLIACAELDGRLEEFESLIQQKHFLLMPETLLRENGFNYHTSIDAIVSVVVKWCGGDKCKWDCFAKWLGFYGEFYAFDLLPLLLIKSPPQILDALLLAAGKMPQGGG